MTAQNAPFTLTEAPAPALQAGEALVEVAGCGVCHTDMSFWHAGVQTRHPLPLTLGHEISGRVVSGPADLVGKAVIVPAVLPCGDCELCRSGRSNICQNQRMPGNDFHGGFATHVVVPARFLCVVPDGLLSRFPLEKLAVIADAVSTPYQVVKKADIRPGDFAIAIGVGGVGIYGAMLARIAGATVLGIDVNDERLAMAEQHGAAAVLNTANLDAKSIKTKVRDIARAVHAPAYGWKIFEFSGTKAGQELAFNLMSYASTVSIVGFTMDKLEVRLSNLMAFDATMIGTWGCKPELYPEVVDLVAAGKLSIEPFVETHPLSDVNNVFQAMLGHSLKKRAVLIP